MPLDILIEGLLFYKSAPQKKAALIKLYSVSTDDLTVALQVLAERLNAGATRLVETATDIQLVTAPSLAPFITDLRKTDIKNDIGKAGSETLAIILYRGPIGRSEIDRIRGVNSSFILRNLLIRGLIERNQLKSGGGYTYTITPALFMQLGITSAREIDDFARIADALELFLTAKTGPTETTAL
jgi:segregation and condensation protein B